MTRNFGTVLIYLLILFVAAGGIAAVRYNRSLRVPDRSEAVGPFDIITHTGDDRYYSIRYHGKPFVFEGKAGMFGDTTASYKIMNAVITFPSKEPALVVNVGDPNNASFFYLLREINGAAHVEFAGASSGEVSADFLDPAPDDFTGQRNVAVHRARLHGGRWLLLGQFTVLDVETMEIFRFAYHPGASINQFKASIAMAPDHRSFVRFGYGESPDNIPLLIVFVFADSTSYSVPIDRRVMRFNQWEDIDAAWLDYYYLWQTDQAGHATLVARPGVKPMPYHGRLTRDTDGYREYNVLPVTPEMKDRLVEFIERAFGATRLPPPEYDGGATQLKIGAETVSVMITNENYASVWMDRGVDSRLVEEIGKRFDEELKGGSYDDLFIH